MNLTTYEKQSILKAQKHGIDSLNDNEFDQLFNIYEYIYCHIDNKHNVFDILEKHYFDTGFINKYYDKKLNDYPFQLQFDNVADLLIIYKNGKYNHYVINQMIIDVLTKYNLY